MENSVHTSVTYTLMLFYLRHPDQLDHHIFYVTEMIYSYSNLSLELIFFKRLCDVFSLTEIKLKIKCPVFLLYVNIYGGQNTLGIIGKRDKYSALELSLEVGSFF